MLNVCMTKQSLGLNVLTGLGVTINGFWTGQLDLLHVRPRVHQENWQPQRNHNFREMSPISRRQLVSRLADAR
jgi:hypothetical protein